MSDDTPEGVAETRASAPSGRKRRVRIVLLSILAVAIVGGTIWYLNYRSFGRYQQSTDNAFIQADAVTVSPRVAGYVVAVYAVDNQRVRAGDPLVRIDAREYDAQARQAQALIGVARASAEGIEAQIGEQDAAIVRAQAEVDAARDDERFAAAEVVRYTPLAASGAEPRERLAQLRNQAQQADARVVNAQAALLSARRRVATLRAQVRQAQAQGASAQAQLESARVDVGASIIRASIAGRIGDKSVRTGQYAQAGTRLMSIVPVDRLYISANFKETQMGLMRVGQPVRVEIDALPGVDIPGRVVSISPGTGAQFSVLPPQNATGNFTKIVQRVPVRIGIAPTPEARAALVPGMSAEITVDTRSARGAEHRVAQAQERANDRGEQ